MTGRERLQNQVGEKREGRGVFFLQSDGGGFFAGGGGGGGSAWVVFSGTGGIDRVRMALSWKVVGWGEGEIAWRKREWSDVGRGTGERSVRGGKGGAVGRG